MDGSALEVWRGCVNAWECDELGHMNVRFYLARAYDGLAKLAAALGQPHAFAAEANATLQVVRQHVRFLQEARAGAPLYMTGGLVEMQEDGALALEMLHHLDGRPCATVLSHLRHATPHGRAFSWPARAHDAVQDLTIPVPDFAKPRNFASQEPIEPQAAWTEDLTSVSLAPITTRDCDVFGYMTPDTVMARVSDGMSHLTTPIYAAIATYEPERRLSTAALEYRIDHLQRPRTGDLVEVRSRVVGLAKKVIQVEHWLCDPVARRVWARAVGVHANFDLDSRRAVAFSADIRRRLPPL